MRHNSTTPVLTDLNQTVPYLEIALCGKSPSTDRACKRFLASVCAFVDL